ncbi:DUF350 domain-containing protein [Aquimarina brevivitae]|uniref:Uncharacterized membrane protein YjfL (UPF0719 family) n=1 Tax=Aquimarina brevivitae TaxID=323412 RepID=A0A4Q7PLY4_9FLAO|nr:DUF350 domain-containing protein [Aquimarina brevivitae]RZT00003.1 uncharacterized membrane protein YjfL (UPF0719 family) [Aquimarina brevivitae]
MEIIKSEYVVDFLASLSYILLAILILIIGKLIYQLIYRKLSIKNELVFKDNFAFSVAYVGYFIGILLVIGGAIIGESYGWIEDIKAILYYSTIGIILINISKWINNKVILRKFNVTKEIISDQNTGTGVVEASVFIGAGLVLFGAISGESGGFLIGSLTAISYWSLGMLFQIIACKLYISFIGYDVHDQIEKDNVAVGVALSGIIIAISIVVMNALLGDFQDWKTTLLDISSQTTIGLLLLPLMRVIADKILLPGQRLTDEIINQENPNVGAALVEAFAYVGSAVLIAWSI